MIDSSPVSQTTEYCFLSVVRGALVISLRLLPLQNKMMVSPNWDFDYLGVMLTQISTFNC